MYKMNRAFSLIELMVSISIISVILSVVLYNYGSFNDRLALSSATQELAIGVRQAQTYGINVKESAVNSGLFNFAYGIYFSFQTPSNYRIFVDSDSTSPNNNEYDASSESVELVSFRNGVTISDVCNNSTAGCTRPVGAVGISVTFLRPNPDAKIYFTDINGNKIAGGPVSFAKVQLRSPKGNFSYVTIVNTGQVVVQ